jgi:hypothetical protein
MSRNPDSDDPDRRRRRAEDFDEDYDDQPEYEDRPRRRIRDIPSYLTQAILCTLFCCMPFGIVAIVFAAQVNTKVNEGDYAGAEKASAQAKMWCWISFGVGLVTVPIVAVIQFAAFSAQQRGGRF